MNDCTRYRNVLFYLLTVIYISTTGCGTVASVRPIGARNSALTFSMGGPVIPIYDISSPAPYSVLRYKRGLNANTDIHFGFHPTMAALGNLSIDAGITKHLGDESGWRPALAVEGSIYGFYHIGESSSIRVYPELSLTGSYKLSQRRHLLYFGTHTMYQTVSPHVIFAPFIGFEIPFGRKFIFNIETKWYAPHEESENRVVDYTIKPWNQGALGFMLGLTLSFYGGTQ